MRKTTTYILLFISALAGNISGAMAQVQPLLDTTVELHRDTLRDQEVIEDKIIDEMVQEQTPLRKDKIQYFSQLTRYGFKNLFPRYSYNPSVPYAAQINSNASGFIENYMRQHSKYLIGMKSWGQPYFNLIENILAQYGLPKELKYIAVIESNLSTGAVSNKGAGGPWQFMPATARQFNLVINNYTDERTDYFKSTHAAAKYLLMLYKQMKDWLLVMAAYNGGPGRVLNAIRRSGSTNFWVLQQYLPEESRTYVKRFIATHYIMEGGIGLGDFGFASGIAANTGATNTYMPGNPYELNKPMIPQSELDGMETSTISGKYISIIIARQLSMELNQFNRLNPNMDGLLGTNGNYDLRLPPDKMQFFLANKYVILNECVNSLLQEGAINYDNHTSYPSRYRTTKKAKKHS